MSLVWESAKVGLLLRNLVYVTRGTIFLYTPIEFFSSNPVLGVRWGALLYGSVPWCPPKRQGE